MNEKRLFIVYCLANLHTMAENNLLKLSFLSQPIACLNGEPVSGFISDKVVALLSYLVLNEKTHSREALAGLLWGEFEGSRAKANLRQALHNLQNLLPGYFLVSRKTVSFSRERPFWVDVFEFEKATQEQLTISESQPLIALYKNDFLAGFYVDGAPDFESWQRIEQERLRLLLLKSLSQLSQRYEEQKKWEQQASVIRQLLTIEPWNESAHRQLILALARMGHFEAALVQYESCILILAGELGISPSKATQDLADRVRSLRNRPKHNLPPQPTPFIGRKVERNELNKHLSSPETRLVTIVATGGMGKTRLALAAAFEQIGAFLEGIAFIPLAPIEQPSLLATAIVELLSEAGFIPPHQGHKSAENFLLDELANREVLLVLDNYEQLLPDVSLILKILDKAPQVKLIVSSRERLNIRWEKLFFVDGLPYPTNFDSQNWQMFSAPQLFLQTARQVRPDYAPSDNDLKAIVEICQLVEGMPLALELAATWLRVQEPQSIALELSENLAFLKTHQRDVPARQQSMHAIFDQTWGRLPLIQKNVLARLSVFRGLFALEAADQVAGLTRQLAISLIDKSLLRQRPIQIESETAVYYEMHELLRQYAAERLDRQSETFSTKKKHCRYYAHYLASFKPQLLSGETQSVTLKQMQREIDNYRAAWDWALTNEQGDVINLMQESIYQFYYLPSLVRDGQTVMAEAANKLKPVQHKNNELRLAYGRLLAKQGEFTWLLHEDYPEAKRLVQESNSIFSELGSNIDLAQGYTVMANIIYQQDLETARKYWQQSLEMYKQEGHQQEQAALLRNLCVTAPTYTDMLAYWQAALETAVLTHARRQEGHLYFIRGDNEFCAGHHQVGQELTQKSIEIIRETGDPPHLILALNVLANILLATGKIHEAQRLLKEMQELAQQLSIKWHSQLVVLASARQTFAENKFDTTENIVTILLAEMDTEGSYKTLCQQAFLLLGRLKILQAEYVNARAYWQQSLEIDLIPSFANSSHRWHALVGIGETWLSEGDGETAVSYFQQAQKLATDTGAHAAWALEWHRLETTYALTFKK